MFELPQTKRVRRSELLDSPSHEASTSPPPENALERLYSILNFEYEYLNPAASSPSASNAPANENSDCSKKRKRQSSSADAPSEVSKEKEGDQDEEEYLFPLFSSLPSDTKSQLVPLRDTPPPPPSSFELYLESYNRAAASQRRPDSYYFHQGFPESHLASLSPIVVTGEQILAEGRTWKEGGLYWPGSTLPWKVMTVCSTATVQVVRKHRKKEGVGKCKPSKKRRIMLKREKERKIEEAKKMELLEKEKREKRMVKNREKKIKKRMREKEKKAAAKAGEVGTQIVEGQSPVG